MCCSFIFVRNMFTQKFEFASQIIAMCAIRVEPWRVFFNTVGEGKTTKKTLKVYAHMNHRIYSYI